MKYILFMLPFALFACASSSDVTEEDHMAKATDECLSNPAMAKSWGDCNVKTTIYDRMDVIMNCQSKFGSAKKDFIHFDIEVNPKGRVTKVGASKNANKNSELEICLKREISKMRFAAPPKGVKPVIGFPYRN